MKNLIVIDACNREGESRTWRIASPIIEALKERYEVSEYHLPRMKMEPVDAELHQLRSSGNAPQWAVDAAKDIASADRILIAAPFWDMSFPAILKTFIEHVSLFNVTFADNGTECYGLCKCEKVLYITTRGMNIPMGDCREQATPYIKALSSLWGLGELHVIDAWNMDYRTPESAEAEIDRCIAEGLEIAEDF